ncbi:MAG TPA: hypothetical protein VLH84_01050 [Patescibacteria group bacterium]|nr:hypothetical protein [Patescibacteria group bacterium]
MKFIPEPNQLTIKLEGWEILWALKTHLQIPHFAIAEINYIPELPLMQDFRGYLRAPGSAIPWRFLAGTYYGLHGGREFWYVHFRQPGLLVINLRKDAFTYDRIRLSCTPEIAQSVVDWWRAKT